MSLNLSDLNDAPLAFLDANHFIDTICARFGFTKNIFDDYLFFQANKRTISIVHKSLQPMRKPCATTIGIPFYNIKIKPPKLTTAAAMLFGKHATKNIVLLEETQEKELVLGHTFAIPEKQTKLCTSAGYALAFRDSFCLGVAYYYNNSTGFFLRSHFPKDFTT